jgi:hypothetical protein
MATKKSTKKPKATKKSSKKSQHSEPGSAAAELKPNELLIKFDHPSQILPKLLELAHHFSPPLEAAAPADADVLGGARARLIVSSCAHSTAWGATLSDLALNPVIFRNCVAAGVKGAGYVPPPIPATPDTRLIDVVAVIQTSPRKP